MAQDSRDQYYTISTLHYKASVNSIQSWSWHLSYINKVWWLGHYGHFLVNDLDIWPLEVQKVTPEQGAVNLDILETD